MSPAEFLRSEPDRRARRAVLALFVPIALVLVSESTAVPAITWMHIFEAEDFPTFADALQFLSELRVPIPPVVALLEILNHQFDGTTDFVSKGLYRLSLVFAYLAALSFARTSYRRLLLSFLISVVFLWSTVIFHPGNPQIYDALFPAFVLAWLFFLSRVRLTSHDYIQYGMALAAGFFLSMAELSRPFVIALLPFMVCGSFLILARSGPSTEPGRARHWRLAMFVLPVLIISGGWHTQLLMRHGQLTSSNHVGFNLRRAWHKVKAPDLIEEVNNAPLGPERWKNLNTPEHFENSRIRQRAVAYYILTHPLYGVSNSFVGLRTLLSPRTAINNYKPEHPIFWLYKPLVWGSSLWLMLQLAYLGRSAVRARGKSYRLLAEPDNLILITAAACLAIHSVGDRHEEARFMVEILPLIAALGVARPIPVRSRKNLSANVPLSP